MKKIALIFSILVLFVGMIQAQSAPPNPNPRDGCPQWLNTLPTAYLQTNFVMYYRTFEVDEPEGAIMKWDVGGYVSPLLYLWSPASMQQSTWYSQEQSPNFGLMLESQATPPKGRAVINLYVTKEGCGVDIHTITFTVTQQIVP